MRRNVLALLFSIPLFLTGAAFANADQVAVNDDLNTENVAQDTLSADDMNTEVNLDEGNTDEWWGRGWGGWGRWGGWGGWGRWGGWGGWGRWGGFGGWGRWGLGGWGGWGSWWPTYYLPIYSSWYY